MRKYILYILSFYAFVISAYGADLQITKIKPDIVRENLCVSALLENLFSEQIEGTILSGLPALIYIDIRLLSQNNDKEIRREIALKIVHDVWKDIFFIEMDNERFSTSSFDSAKARISHLHNIKIANLRVLQIHGSYHILIRAEVVGISKVQSDKLRDWIIQSNETSEQHTAEKRESGFWFSLTRLVSSLIGRNKKSEFRTDWRQSEIFKLDELR